MTGDEWTIVFRETPGAIPVVHRIRALLKSSLRRLGLRCITIAGPPEDAQDARPAAAGPTVAHGVDRPTAGQDGLFVAVPSDRLTGK